MRGMHVSTPIEELVKQAHSLAAAGVKELILIAQDLTYYGFDLYKKRNLAELLEALAQVDGIDWIRLHYAFPAGFPMDVLDVMVKYPKICNYLDMPLQHVSDNVLKAMRRGMNKAKTIELVHQIRERVPGIAMRTTLLVGHPGETEQDFEDLKAFVTEMKFDRLGVFTYSHEESTHAYTMTDDVPEEVKQARAEEIMAIQQYISQDKNKALVGHTMKVLIDKKESGYFVGRTEFDSPEVDNEVLVDASKHYLRVGDFATIKITSAEDFDLYGEVV
jgi:ribosomal protein S12 methylthiotransferase